MGAPVAPVASRDEAQGSARLAGHWPPLPGWAPLAWFIALAVTLTFVVVALVQRTGSLDDPEPAYQRDGLLLSGAVLPERVVGVEFGGRPVVLLFLREPPQTRGLAERTAAVPDRADTVVVLPAPTTEDLPAPTVIDPLNGVGGVVELAEPADRGRPVGYAVVDSDRVVRYATLDSHYLTNAFEISTILGVVR